MSILLALPMPVMHSRSDMSRLVSSAHLTKALANVPRVRRRHYGSQTAAVARMRHLTRC